MTNWQGTYIIIPAFNEEQVIKGVIKEIQKEGYRQIIVIDDGSEDNTYFEALSNGVIVLRHMLNRGKGAAVKTGIEAGKLLGAQRIITFDADGQHNAKDITKLLTKINQGWDVVLGARRLNRKQMPLVKVVANYLGNFFTWVIYGIWVTDSQSGLRGYSKKALNLIDTKHDRYEYDSEVLREIVRYKLRYIEAPVDVRYTKYSMSKIQKQSLVNGVKTLIRLIITS